MTPIAIFASGTGTNALNLLEAAKNLPHVDIRCLIIDSLSSPLPQIVTEAYPATMVELVLPLQELKGLERRAEHEKRIIKILQQHEVQWIMLAGYMRILGTDLLKTFEQRIVNIHPSLLPQYPGVDSYRRAFEDKVSESGVTLHLVDEGIDTGPILLQRKFPRLEFDTLEDFIERGKKLEWEMYPLILKQLNDSAELLPGE